MAINALTLWAVMQAQIIPVGEHASKDRSAFDQFFKNVETMAQKGNKRETVIYFTMLFSLVIWVIAALSLIVAAILWIVFLWAHIPSTDGTLSKYCRRKIETRLDHVVKKTVNKAIRKQNLKHEKALKKGDGNETSQRAPTLPKFGTQDDDTSSIYSMTRSDTMSTAPTLPPYTSNPPSRTNTTATNRTLAMKPSLPSLDERPMLSRSETQFSTYSNVSYSSNAPLMSEGASMGRSSPAPPMPTLDRNADYFNGPPGPRPYSPMSQGRASPRPPRNVLPPVNTGNPNDRISPGPLVSPLQNDPRGLTSPPQGKFPRRIGPSPLGDLTFSPYDNRAPNMGPSYEMSPVDMTPSELESQHLYSGSNASNNFRPPQLPTSLRAGSPAQAQSMNSSFTSPPPSRSGTAPPSNPRAGIPAALQSAIQRREASQPLPNRGMTAPFQQQRSATAPIQQLGGGPGALRSQTTSPGARRYDNGYDNPYGGGQMRDDRNGW